MANAIVTPIPVATPVPVGTPAPTTTPPPPAGAIVRTCVFGNPYPGQYSTNYYLISTTGGGSAFGYILVAAWVMDPAACASPTPTPAPPPVAGTLPCPEFALQGGQAVLDCTGYQGHSWSLSARVSSACPINEVLRRPYPQTLVGLATNLKLLPTHADENWSQRLTHPDVANGSALAADGTPRRAGLFRELQLGLRSERLRESRGYWLDQRIPPVAFHFSDHAWNAAHRQYPVDQTSTGKGIDSDGDALFVYETSSWGLPLKGRGFDYAGNVPARDNGAPAYRVTVTAPCGHAWRVVWTESVQRVTRVDYDNGRCYLIGTIRNTDPTLRYTQENCAPGYEHYWNETVAYDWEDRDTGWHEIDLRTAAHLGTAYYPMTTVRAGGVYRGQSYWEDTAIGPELRIPVLEAQGVLVPQCYAEGRCELPAPDPGALQPTPAVRVDPP